MPSFNRVIIAGNLTRDPEARHLASGTEISQISLAVNRKWRDSAGQDQEEVGFFDVTFFGRVAEVVNAHLAKGRPVLVEGRLKWDTWEDRQTGAKRSKVHIIGDRFEFLGGRDDREEDRGGSVQSRVNSSPPSRPSAAASRSESATPELAGQDDGDEIPF